MLRDRARKREYTAEDADFFEYFFMLPFNQRGATTDRRDILKCSGLAGQVAWLHSIFPSRHVANCLGTCPATPCRSWWSPIRRLFETLNPLTVRAMPEHPSERSRAHANRRPY